MKKSNWCTVFTDEDGKQMVKTPNGEIISGVFATKIEQENDEAHSGVCRVTIELWCNAE